MFTTTKTEGKLIEVKVEGKITHDDYEKIIPKLEKIIEDEGAIRCLIEIPEIEGIEPQALIDDLKFDAKHARDIERCAVVTDSNMLARMTKLWGTMMPDTEVKTFSPDDRAAAEVWIRG